MRPFITLLLFLLTGISCGPGTYHPDALADASEDFIQDSPLDPICPTDLLECIPSGYTWCWNPSLQKPLTKCSFPCVVCSKEVSLSCILHEKLSNSKENLGICVINCNECI